MAAQQVLCVLRFFRGPDATLHPLHRSPGCKFIDLGAGLRCIMRCGLHWRRWDIGLAPICLPIGDLRHACVSQSGDGQVGRASHVIGRGCRRLSLCWRWKKCCGSVVITDSHVLGGGNLWIRRWTDVFFGSGKVGRECVCGLATRCLSARGWSSVLWVMFHS